MSVGIKQLPFLWFANAGCGFEVVDFENDVVVFGCVLDDRRVPSLVERIRSH